MSSTRSVEIRQRRKRTIYEYRDISVEVTEDQARQYGGGIQPPPTEDWMIAADELAPIGPADVWTLETPEEIEPQWPKLTEINPPLDKPANPANPAGFY